MVDRIRYPTVSYLPFYYAFFQFLLLTIFNLQANILTTKDILSNLDQPLLFPLQSVIYKWLSLLWLVRSCRGSFQVFLNGNHQQLKASLSAPITIVITDDGQQKYQLSIVKLLCRGNSEGCDHFVFNKLPIIQILIGEIEVIKNSICHDG